MRTWMMTMMTTANRILPHTSIHPLSRPLALSSPPFHPSFPAECRWMGRPPAMAMMGLPRSRSFRFLLPPFDAL